MTNKWNIKIQRITTDTYDDTGFVQTEHESPNKTFYLESKDGTYSRRYSTESAPLWVKEIYNRCYTQQT